MTEWSVRTDHIRMMEIRSWQNRKTWGNRFLSWSEVWEEGLSRGSRTFTVVSTNKNINKGKYSIQSDRQQLRQGTKFSANTLHAHIFFLKDLKSSSMTRYNKLSGTTHRSIFVLQERTSYFTVLQEDFPPLTRVPFASFVLVIQQLVWHQHEPASLPVVYKVTLFFQRIRNDQTCVILLEKQHILSFKDTVLIYVTYTRMILHKILQK